MANAWGEANFFFSDPSGPVSSLHSPVGSSLAGSKRKGGADGGSKKLPAGVCGGAQLGSPVEDSECEGPVSKRRR